MVVITVIATIYWLLIMCQRFYIKLISKSTLWFQELSTIFLQLIKQRPRKVQVLQGYSLAWEDVESEIILSYSIALIHWVIFTLGRNVDSLETSSERASFLIMFHFYEVYFFNSAPYGEQLLCPSSNKINYFTGWVVFLIKERL